MGKFLVKDTSRAGTGNQGAKATAPPDDAQTDSVSSDIPSDVIFPDQLNRYFRDQIHSLTIENGGLRRSLEELQEELSATRQKLKASQPSPMGRVAEMADFKIAQLSKRLREQNAEMESLRTQTKEAEAKLRRLEDKAPEPDAAPSPCPPNELAEKDKQIKTLADKLQAANAKLCDYRNQYTTLKQEMKLAQKVIESEIGEKCVLQDLAKENGSWRGRAQQILALQNKVHQLQEQLSITNATDNPASSVLRQMEKDRRASYEETSKQLNQKTIQMEDLRKKLEAAKARNKVLENEMIQSKTKLAALVEKGARDEQLLSTLTTQINAFEDRGRAQMQCFSKLHDNMSKIQQDFEVEKTKNEQLQRALAERESRIRRMEEQINELRKSYKSSAEHQHQHEDDDDDDDDDMCDGVRPQQTADKSTETSAAPNRLKSANVADTERTRLLELLSVVNKRLEAARKEQDDAESQLRKERYKTAKLETKIARLELEKVGAMKTGRGSYSQGSTKTGDANAEDADILAQQHIEYLEEECLALKTRIETLQMEREEDLRVFATLGEARECISDSQVDARLRKTNSPVVYRAHNRNPERKAKLERKRVQRFPARSGCMRQCSFSSEDVKYFDNVSENRCHT